MYSEYPKVCSSYSISSKLRLGEFQTSILSLFKHNFECLGKFKTGLYCMQVKKGENNMQQK